MNRAISALLPETIKHLKLTEQGEMISANYMNPDIVHRHLEQIMHASIHSQLNHISKSIIAKKI